MNPFLYSRFARCMLVVFMMAMPGAMARAGEPMEGKEVRRRCWADPTRARKEMNELRARLTHPLPSCEMTAYTLAADRLVSLEQGKDLDLALLIGKSAQFVAPNEKEYRTGLIEKISSPAGEQPLTLEIRELGSGELYRLNRQTTSEVYIDLNDAKRPVE